VALRIADRWIWDFWLVEDGRNYHVFFLQAPRSLGDSDLRHWNVSIGHAVSADLRSWEVLTDALAPGRAGEWDDYTTWTGSIIRHNDVWHMFYTGGTRHENGLIQRIGLATSRDLVTWTKHPGNPLLVLDPRWYEPLDLTSWHDQAWRDPWLLQDPRTSEWHAFVTARSASGVPDGRGVIGRARSVDLMKWEVLPPLTQPGDFGHLEVPQVVAANGTYYLLFSVPAADYSARRRAAGIGRPVTGTHYAILTDVFGSAPSRNGHGFGTPLSPLYGGKLVSDPHGGWCFLGWIERDGSGAFAGEISDPIPVEFGPSGALVLTT
jgi:beta-fructofuranosidase